MCRRICHNLADGRLVVIVQAAPQGVGHQLFRDGMRKLIGLFQQGRSQPCKGVPFGSSRLRWTAVHGGTAGVPGRLTIRPEQRLVRA